MRRVSVSMMFGVLAAVGLSTTADRGVVTAAGDARNYILLTNQGARLTDAVLASGGQVTGAIDEIGVVTVSSQDPAFLANIGKHAGVQYAMEDIEVQWLPEVSPVLSGEDVIQFGVNAEPFNGFQWNIRAIGADKTAAADIVGSNVKRARVAVLDSGLWINHPDLAGNVNALDGKSYVNTEAWVDGPDADDIPDTLVPAEPGIEPIVSGFNHGTHVAGIIAAAINGRGAQGVAPEAEIVPFKVLRSTTGSGSFTWVANAIVDAANIDADVINMSLGATFARPLAGGYGPYVQLLTRAINYATEQGTLVVVAAGNEGVDLDSIFWSVPAQLGLALAVSATGPEGIAYDGEANVNLDRFASYSNFGRSVVDVAAPGGDYPLYPDPNYVFDMVLSPGGRSASGSYQYYFAAGTSMAAPHVAGLAALIVGEHGKMSPAKLKATIEQHAVDLYKPGADPYSGRGRIDAARVFGLP